MSHTVNGQPTNFTWDTVAGMPVVLQDGTNTYVYGLDLISATDGSGAQTYLTYDGLGSTTDLTDGNAAVTGAYSYDVFGAIRSQSGGGSNYWLFTGEQSDASEALYFLRARYYDPMTGRFVGRDPLRLGNRYSYVSVNPVNLVDPLGLCGLDDPGDVLDCVGDAWECVVDPLGCAAEAFVGSSVDKELVNLAGQLAKDFADSHSDFVNKEGGVNLVQNCGSAFCTLLFTLTQTPNCVTVGNTILCKGPCSVGTSCFRHESTHVRQYREFGFFGFYAEYFDSDPKNVVVCLAEGHFIDLMKCIYRNRPFEKEATRNEDIR